MLSHATVECAGWSTRLDCSGRLVVGVPGCVQVRGSDQPFLFELLLFEHWSIVHAAQFKHIDTTLHLMTCPTDESLTRNVIKNLQSKSSSGKVDLSTKVLKLITVEISEAVKLIINQSIATGICQVN